MRGKEGKIAGLSLLRWAERGKKGGEGVLGLRPE